MKVIKVTNAKVRGLIEQFTRQYTPPDAIEFVQDGAGNWITAPENITNLRYTGIRQDLNDFLKANGINTNIRSLKEALERYGTLIDFIPVAADL